MRAPISISVKDWQAFIRVLEDAFGVQLPETVKAGEVNVEELLVTARDLAPDPGKQGQIVITHELRQALSSLLAIPASDIGPLTPMATLMPGRARKQVIAQLQREVDWKLPRLGLPVWAQSVWGAGLMIGFVLQFIYPWWGIALFWGGMLLSFQVEKVAWAFQYPTFGHWVARCVQLNWPALQMGGVDADRLRVAFAELLRMHWPTEFDPRVPFPTVHVQDLLQGLGPQWHILNGDALRLSLEAADFPGERIVMRECMAVGPVAPHEDFFRRRSQFIADSYAAPPEKYQQWVMAELDKIPLIPAEADINLWFEDDLFCQANYWFLLHRLTAQGRQTRLFRVLPLINQDAPRWAGFAYHTQAELETAFQARLALTESDLKLASALWQAYSLGDVTQLQALANNTAPQWRGLQEAVAAYIAQIPSPDGLGKPVQILQQLLADGILAFEEAFRIFSEQAGEYGYGDLQVRAIWDKLLADKDSETAR